MTCVKDIYNYINSVAPFDTQAEWDNAGIITGSPEAQVTKAVMSLDVTKAVAEKAVSSGAELILSHHPLIFNAVKRLYSGSALYNCVNHGISVISAHTNFDRAENGINTNLCRLLGIKNVQPIEDTFIVVGELENEMRVADFARFVSAKLHVSGLRFTDSHRVIKKVAVGGGACEEYLRQAMQLADCFLTGDAKYHVMLEAVEENFCLISAGHYETEYSAFMMLKDRLAKEFPDVEFVSADQENPVSAVF